MFRFLRLPKSLNCKRMLHTFKAQELDVQAYHMKPLDRHAIELMKKFSSDIHYSSYVETNKKPLSYKARSQIYRSLKAVEYKARMGEIFEPPPTVLTKSDERDNGNLMKACEPATEQCKQAEQLEVRETESGESFANGQILLWKSKLKILTELGLRRSALEYELKSFPDNWMQDYEMYDECEDSDVLVDSQYGTPDPAIPISKVPCHGCGSKLQCAEPSLPGYLPSELMRDQKEEVLRTMICQRCHFLKNYNTALKVKVNAEEYIEMISNVKDETSLFILMVDLTDFPCSLWPNIIEVIGKKRPVIVVGNKVDLLPQDSREYLDHIKSCLSDGLVDFGITEANLKEICLISSETNYGVEDLVTTLYDVWPNKGNVYLIGNTNVGKSTLFNALMRSDYCKVKARNLIKRATSSVWPGTTLKMLKFPIARASNALIRERKRRLRDAFIQRQQLEKLRRQQIMTGRTPEKTLIEHIGQSLEEKRMESISNEVKITDEDEPEKFFDENDHQFARSKWLFDTPGVLHDQQTINLLTSEELLRTISKESLWPRVFYIKPGTTLFLAGLGRIDYVGGADRVRLAVFASDKLTTLIVNTVRAEEIYDECLGSELINVPCGNERRISEWPKLLQYKETISVSNYDSERKSVCDIVLSSAGWVSVNLPVTETAHFHAWTPGGKGIFVRKPSLLPFAGWLYRGKRVKYTPAYLNREPSRVLH